jgi:hypothetical protein
MSPVRSASTCKPPLHQSPIIPNVTLTASSKPSKPVPTLTPSSLSALVALTIIAIPNPSAMNDWWLPTEEWRRDDTAPGGWRQTTYKGDKAIDGEVLHGGWA